MNTKDVIAELLERLQTNAETKPAAERLLAKFEDNVRRAFGSGGTVAGKLAMVDEFRSQFAKGLRLLVDTKPLDAPFPWSPAEGTDPAEVLGTVRHGGKHSPSTPADVPELPAGDQGEQLDQLPPLPAPESLDQGEQLVGDLLPPLPAPESLDQGEQLDQLPPLPAPESLDQGEQLQAPDHPTRRDHPARPSGKKRKS